MLFSSTKNMVAILALGSLLSVAHNAQAASWTPTADQAKRAAVALAAGGVAKYLADRQVDKSPNKVWHAKLADGATSVAKWLNDRPLALAAAYLGYTVLADYVKLPARAAAPKAQTPPPVNLGE